MFPRYLSCKVSGSRCHNTAPGRKKRGRYNYLRACGWIIFVLLPVHELRFCLLLRPCVLCTEVSQGIVFRHDVLFFHDTLLTSESKRRQKIWATTGTPEYIILYYMILYFDNTIKMAVQQRSA